MVRLGLQSSVTRRQRTVLRAANEARDRRDWREATTQYRRFLDEVPTNAAIWTQLGHALKESGHWPDAEAAYRTGLAFAPQDAELHLQLGHVLKLQGRLLEAEKAYLRSSALDATLGAEGEINWKSAPASPITPRVVEAAKPRPAEEADTEAPPAPNPGVRPEVLEQAGDDARDRGAFADAARSYQAFLDLVPNHAGIWVQLGHAMREQGDLKASEKAYRTAIQVAPRDADAHFQLGHNLWIQKRQEEAFEAFRQSLAFNASRVTVQGVRAAGYRIEYEDIPPHKSNKTQTYLEISDLIGTMREYRAISGIQRVQLGLIKFILDGEHDCAVVFWEDGLLWSIEIEALRGVIGVYDMPVQSKRRRDLIEKMLRASKPVRPSPGETFVITGAIWTRPNPALDHQRLKSDRVRLGAYIYDFIPLTNPEFCHPYLTDRFSTTIAELMLQLDFAFCISDHVASEFRRLRRDANYPDIPVDTVKLAHVMDTADAAAAGPAWPSELASLRGKDFVLCVGSVAAHKNHILAVQVWRLLAARGIQPPILVIVGKIGYGVEDLVNQLKATQNLGGQVMLLLHLNDAALKVLYRSCLFTMFPSYVEGWGLPVGESLTYGKACLASSTTAIPEVGGDFVTYIDPYDTRAATDAVAALLTEKGRLQALEARIKAKFIPRTWDDFGADFVAALRQPRGATDTLLRMPAAWVMHPLVRPPAWPYGHSLPTPAVIAMATAPRVALNAGWLPPEDWGCWMDGRASKLSLAVNVRPGSLVRVVLQCRSVFWPRRTRLTLSATSGETATVAVPSGAKDFLAQLECVVSPSGWVDLELTIGGHLSKIAEEPRLLGIGLRKLFYVDIDTKSERIAAGLLMRPTALTAATGAEVTGYSLDAMLEASRRRAMLTQGWLTPEAWGTWMAGQEARITLRPNAPPNAEIRVIMRLRSSARQGGLVTLKAGGPHATAVLAPGEMIETMASVSGIMREDGTITVSITVKPMEARLGLTAVAWADRSDQHTRLAAVESILFDASASPDDDTVLLGREMNFTVAGHFTGTYSLASVNRRLAITLDEANLGQVRVVQVEGQPTKELTGLSGEDHTRFTALGRALPSNNGVRVVISQHWPVWPADLPHDLALAYVFWEESTVPRDMIQTLNSRFHGVLVPTRIVGKSLIDSGLRIPVRHIGFAPDLAGFEALADERVSLDQIGPDRPFTFLHVSSCFPRKGVDVLLAAYAQTFSSLDPVRLVIKGFPNPHNDVAAQIASLRAAGRDLAPIEFIEIDLPDDALLDLYRDADAIVLPTRGEGFNIPAAEAMAAGIPLIVTGFGGQADFTSDGVARLIDYRFAHSGSHLRTSSSVWVEPDIKDLAVALNEAVETAKLSPVDRAAATNRARTRASQVGDPRQWARRIRDAANEILAIGSVPSPTIAWVSTWKVRCGVAEYSRMLLDSFPAAARDVTVLCDTRTADGDLSGPGAVARKVWSLWDSNTMDSLAAAIGDTGAQIVVIQYHHALITWNDLATLLEDDRVCTRRIIVTMHNTQELLTAEPLVRKRLVKALSQVSRILVHTVSDLNLLKQEGLVSNVTMFPHGAFKSTLPAGPIRPLSTTDEVRIGTYGFFLPHKGFDRLIEAVAIIRQKYPRLTLRMVCAQYPAPESANEIARCQALAANLGIGDAVEWHLDYLANEQSLQLLNECDLLVLPYQHTPESSSAAVRGALAARVPVVVTPLLIFEELQRAVLRLHGTDVSSIASGVQWVLRHQDARRDLSNAGSDWLEDNSWSNVAQRLSGLITGLVVSHNDHDPLDGDDVPRRA